MGQAPSTQLGSGSLDALHSQEAQASPLAQLNQHLGKLDVDLGAYSGELHSQGTELDAMVKLTTQIHRCVIVLLVICLAILAMLVSQSSFVSRHRSY
jgi:hypothetical protein